MLSSSNTCVFIETIGTVLQNTGLHKTDHGQCNRDNFKMQIQIYYSYLIIIYSSEIIVLNNCLENNNNLNNMYYHNLIIYPFTIYCNVQKIDLLR